MPKAEAIGHAWLPSPLDLSGVELSREIEPAVELLARNIHDVWASKRMEEGWTWGPARSDELRQTPNLVPYEQLDEGEKDYDREVAEQTLKSLISMGFEIRPKCQKTDNS